MIIFKQKTKTDLSQINTGLIAKVTFRKFSLRPKLIN